MTMRFRQNVDVTGTVTTKVLQSEDTYITRVAANLQNIASNSPSSTLGMTLTKFGHIVFCKLDAVSLIADENGAISSNSAVLPEELSPELGKTIHFSIPLADTNRLDFQIFNQVITINDYSYNENGPYFVQQPFVANQTVNIPEIVLLWATTPITVE